MVVHEATTDQMNFQAKNFTYVTKPFGNFLDHVTEGQKQYLRSIASEKPTEKPAELSRDFPEIAEDFILPPELALVKENAHSSPLRISGPVTMWLHYDVSLVAIPCREGCLAKGLFLGDGERPLPDSRHQTTYPVSTIGCYSITLPCRCL